MANNVEVAGISISIGADLSRLDSEMQTAFDKAKSYSQKHPISVSLTADKDSIQGLDKKIADLVREVKPASIPLDIDFHGKAHVEVTWDWADGHGPPEGGASSGGGPAAGGGDEGGTPSRPRPGGNKKKITATTETETPTEAPVQKAAAPRKRRSTVATPEVAAEPAVEQVRARAEGSARWRETEVPADLSALSNEKLRALFRNVNEESAARTKAVIGGLESPSATVAADFRKKLIPVVEEIGRRINAGTPVEELTGVKHPGEAGFPAEFKTAAEAISAGREERKAAEAEVQGGARYAPERAGTPADAGVAPYVRPTTEAQRLGPQQGIFGGGRGRAFRWFMGPEEPHPAGVWDEAERKARQEDWEQRRSEAAIKRMGSFAAAFGGTKETGKGTEVAAFTKERVLELKKALRGADKDIASAVDDAGKGLFDNALAELEDIQTAAAQAILVQARTSVKKPSTEGLDPAKAAEKQAEYEREVKSRVYKAGQRLGRLRGSGVRGSYVGERILNAPGERFSNEDLFLQATSGISEVHRLRRIATQEATKKLATEQAKETRASNKAAEERGDIAVTPQPTGPVRTSRFVNPAFSETALEREARIKTRARAPRTLREQLAAARADLLDRRQRGERTEEQAAHVRDLENQLAAQEPGESPATTVVQAVRTPRPTRRRPKTRARSLGEIAEERLRTGQVRVGLTPEAALATGLVHAVPEETFAETAARRLALGRLPQLRGQRASEPAGPEPTKPTAPVRFFAAGGVPPEVFEDAARMQRIREQNRRAGRLGGLETQRRRRARLGIVAPETAAAADINVDAGEMDQIAAGLNEPPTPPGAEKPPKKAPQPRQLSLGFHRPAPGLLGFPTEGPAQAPAGRRKLVEGGAFGKAAVEETAGEAGPQTLSRAAIEKIIGLDQARAIRDSVSQDTKELFSYTNDVGRLGSEILRENPVRALSTSIGQFFVQTVGGRSNLERQIKVLNKENQTLTQLGRTAARSQADSLAAQAAFRVGDEKQREVLKEQIPQLKKAAEDDAKRVEAQREIVKQREKGLQGARGLAALRTLGVGAIGVAIGTEIFTHLLQGFSAVVDEFDKVLAKAADQVTGFGAAMTRTTESLTQLAAGGAIQGAVATKLAQAGVGGQAAAGLGPALQGLTEGGLASQRTSQFFDLINAQRGLATAAGNAPITPEETPFYQNIGGFRTPFGLTIGGQQPFTQQYGEALRTLNPQGLVGAAQTLSGVSQQLGLPFSVPFAPNPKELQAQQQAFKETVQNFNEAVKQGGGTGGLGVAAGQGETGAQFQQAALLSTLGEGGKALSDAVLGGSVAIRDSNGKLITSLDGLKAVIDAAGKGLAKPNQEELVKAQEFPLKAAIAQRQILGQEQRGIQLPTQAYLATLAQPLVPPSRLPEFRAPGATQTPNFKAATADITDAQTKLQAFADQGRQAAQQFISEWAGPQVLGVWNSATAAVQKYGQQISDIQLSDTWMQVTLQAHQYDNEIRITNRSLADAKEFLTGIKQAGSDNLGIIQKQTRELDIQNTKLGFQATALSLALQQRQINFQVAVAGFVAPGTTPEERAARIEEAKVEAEYAQKQLDINKQQFEIAQKLFGKQQIEITINASRAVTDLQYQLGLLREGRQVTLAVGIDQQRIKYLNDILNQEQAQAQSALQQAIDIRNTILSNQAQLAGELEKDLADVIKTTTGQFEQWLAQLFGVAASFPADNTSTGPAGATGSGPGGPLPVTLNQLGYLGTPETATHFVAGEAGPEAVAVVAQPHQATVRGMDMTVGRAQGQMVGIVKNPPMLASGYAGMMGSGNVPHYATGWTGSVDTPASGGNLNLAISITGNTFRDQNDIDALTTVLIKKIEEKLGRRGAMFGFAVVR